MPASSARDGAHRNGPPNVKLFAPVSTRHAGTTTSFRGGGGPRRERLVLSAEAVSVGRRTRRGGSAQNSVISANMSGYSSRKALFDTAPFPSNYNRSDSCARGERQLPIVCSYRMRAYAALMCRQIGALPTVLSKLQTDRYDRLRAAASFWKRHWSVAGSLLGQINRADRALLHPVETAEFLR